MRMAKLERERQEADQERARITHRQITTANQSLIADRKAREEQERNEELRMARAIQEQSAREIIELEAKAAENTRRLRHNAQIDMALLQQKKRAEESEAHSGGATQTSLISGRPEAQMSAIQDERQRYAQELQSQVTMQKASASMQRQQERQVTWTSLPMQPGYNPADQKAQYRAELLGQMAQKQYKQEAERQQEQAQTNEQRLRDAEQGAEAEVAMREWLRKEQERKDILQAAELKRQENQQAILQEKQIDATVMARSHHEHLIQMGEAESRKRALADKTRAELEMQIQYTQMVKESQKELDKILSGMYTGL